MTKWRELGLEEKVRTILAEVEQNAKLVDHHFNPPFITAYQLAVLLEEKEAGIASKLGKQLGGKGTGEYHSVAQYVAKELSSRISKGEIEDIEGAFLDVRDISKLNFPKDIESSANERLSLFRLKEVKPSNIQGLFL